MSYLNDELNIFNLVKQLKPSDLSDYIGQTHLTNKDSIICDALKTKKIPSMILWGPQGCGKSSLVNVLVKTVQLSDKKISIYELTASTIGINDIKNIVSEAKNGLKNDFRTIIFIKQIQKFNKLQQDIFLPHIENGTFILIGTMHENPFSRLNSALISRCRVLKLEKLNVNNVCKILYKAVTFMKGTIQSSNDNLLINCKEKFISNFFIDDETIQWLADISNGNVKIALTSLEFTVKNKNIENNKSVYVSLSDIKNSLNRMSEKEIDDIDQIYNALHHCILNDEKNAAVYWLARIIAAKEDPVCVAKKLLRIASTDIDNENEDAISVAVHTVEACEMIGMPESDVFLTQCVSYLSEAEKSNEVCNEIEKISKTAFQNKIDKI